MPARDLARHFIERWNFGRRGVYAAHGKDPEGRTPPVLLPFSEATLATLARDYLIQHNIGVRYREPSWRERKSKVSRPSFVCCGCQILRSVSTWSLGVETETSIMAAYVSLIEKAEHFVYIENQFFCSKSADPLPDLPAHAQYDAAVEVLSNKVAHAIYKRLSRAIAKKETFRVVVVLPAYPAFEGTPLNNNCVRAVLLYQLGSIRRLRSTLARDFPKANLDAYLGFYCLRTYDVSTARERVVTEHIYVHAKFMCVDDRACIIGSANLNDRSVSAYQRVTSSVTPLPSMAVGPAVTQLGVTRLLCSVRARSTLC